LRIQNALYKRKWNDRVALTEKAIDGQTNRNYREKKAKHITDEKTGKKIKR